MSNGQPPLKKLQYGFLYILFDAMIDRVKELNIVEWFKSFVLLFVGPDDYSISSRIAVDVFIVAKWVYILFILINQVMGIHIYIIAYLLFTNVFTYFYYHVRHQKNTNDINVVKRGFLHLMLAFFFSNIGFAYVYLYYRDRYFDSDLFSSVVYSFANSLTVSYDRFIISPYGYLISVIQVFITFVFVSLVIANSLPRGDN